MPETQVWVEFVIFPHEIVFMKIAASSAHSDLTRAFPQDSVMQNPVGVPYAHFPPYHKAMYLRVKI